VVLFQYRNFPLKNQVLTPISEKPRLSAMGGIDDIEFEQKPIKKK